MGLPGKMGINFQADHIDGGIAQGVQGMVPEILIDDRLKELLSH